MTRKFSVAVLFLCFVAGNSLLAENENAQAPFIFTTLSPPKEAIFIVHGTFGAQSEWYQEKGNFFQKLFSTIKKTKSDDTNFLDITSEVCLIPFTWSGKWSHTARIKAAKALALSFLEYDVRAIIAHSEGCSVATIACQFLSRAALEGSMLEQMIVVEGILDEAFLTDIPPYTITKRYIEESKIVRSIIYNSLEEIKQAFQEKEPLRGRKEKMRVPYAFYLASPVRQQYSYIPPYTCIEKLLHLYAPNDLAQTLGGILEATFPLNDQTANIAVYFAPSPEKIQEKRPANHCSLHSPSIAPWLLKLPFILKSASLFPSSSEAEKEQKFQPLGKNYEAIFFENEEYPFLQCLKIQN